MTKANEMSMDELFGSFAGESRNTALAAGVRVRKGYAAGGYGFEEVNGGDLVKKMLELWKEAEGDKEAFVEQAGVLMEAIVEALSGLFAKPGKPAWQVRTLRVFMKEQGELALEPKRWKGLVNMVQMALSGAELEAKPALILKKLDWAGKPKAAEDEDGAGEDQPF